MKAILKTIKGKIVEKRAVPIKVNVACTECRYEMMHYIEDHSLMYCGNPDCEYFERVYKVVNIPTIDLIYQEML